MFDICIVGSGPSSLISAQSLLDKGHNVCLIDVGTENKHEIPFKHFGEQLTPESTFFYPPEDDALTTESGGAQVTKARGHIVTNVHQYLKVESDTFSPFQTLASGGLSAAWGAACFTYSDSDLKKASIGTLQSHYEAVAKIIGISCPKHSQFCKIENKQKPALIDHNGQSILSQRQKTFKLEQSSMALLTEPLNGRKANPYFDMDFYSNFGDSIFRGNSLLKTLTQHPNFTRIQGALVTSFKEIDELVQGSITVIKKKLSGAYTLAHPTPYPIKDFYALIFKKLGLKPRFVKLPGDLVLVALKIAGALRIPLPLTSENLFGLKYPMVFESDCVKLGIEPKDFA